MTWFKVDDSFYSHPKVMAIPRGAARLRAIGLWTSLGSWCAQQLTDGHVPAHMIAEHGGASADVKHLVDQGLWIKVDGGYQFHNWAEYQPTRNQVEEKRAGAAERMRRVRANKSARSREVRNVFALRDTNPDPTRPDPTRISVAEAASPRGEDPIHRQGRRGVRDLAMDGRSAANSIGGPA